MTIDVIVVTWRARERVGECLERLRAQTVAHRTIVVDNASEDGTAAHVGESFPDVDVLEMPENVGFGRAVNAGAQQGGAEAIVLVNDDVLVEPHFLRAITEPLAHPKVGMVAGLTLIPGSDVVDAFGIEIDVTLAAYNRLYGRKADERPGRLAGPSGGAAAYRRSAWEAVGGFERRLFAYGEDLDLALRMWNAGWRPAEAPDARGEHWSGATVGADSPLQRRLGGFARGFLMRRYGVLRSRAGPRALLFEAMTVAYGLARHRTLIPLTARLSGFRAGRGPQLSIPREAVDPAIGPREAFRRLRTRRRLAVTRGSGP